MHLLFWLISHIFGVDFRGEIIFPISVQKGSSIENKNELFFLLQFPKNRGGQTKV